METVPEKTRGEQRDHSPLDSTTSYADKMRHPCSTAKSFVFVSSAGTKPQSPRVCRARYGAGPIEDRTRWDITLRVATICPSGNSGPELPLAFGGFFEGGTWAEDIRALVLAIKMHFSTKPEVVTHTGTYYPCRL